MDFYTANIHAAAIAMQAQTAGEYRYTEADGIEVIIPQAPALFLEGTTGIGKTSIAKTMALSFNYFTQVINVPQNEPEEPAGYPKVVGMMINGEKEHCTAKIPAEWAVNLKRQSVSGKYDGVCLICDEVSDASNRLQSAFQGPLLDNKFGRVHVPRLVTVGIFNPPQITTTGGKLAIAVVNRVVMLFDFRTPYTDWINGLCSGFRAPNVPKLPKGWQKRIRYHASILRSYLNQNEAVRDSSDDEILNRNEPWKPIHTRRSWTNAVILMAAAEAAGADERVVDVLVAGCVGEKVSQDFFEWKSRMDLGDPAEYLHPDWHSNEGHFKEDRGDVVATTVGMVATHYLANKTKSNYVNLMKFFRRTAELNFEGIAVSEMLHSQLTLKHNRPKGMDFSEAAAALTPIVEFLHESTLMERILPKD